MRSPIRPTSLICVLTEMLEALALCCMHPALEGTLSGYRDAYRRSRGTEMHPLEPSGFVSGRMPGRRFVFKPSRDFGARVIWPHTETPEGAGAETRLKNSIWRHG